MSTQKSWGVSALFSHGPDGTDIRKLLGIGYLFTHGSTAELRAKMLEVTGYRIITFRTRKQARRFIKERFPTGYWSHRRFKPRVERVNISVEVDNGN